MNEKDLVLIDFKSKINVGKITTNLQEFVALVYRSSVAMKDFWERRQFAPMVNMSKLVLSAVIRVAHIV
jgi:hypothetical protein